MRQPLALALGLNLLFATVYKSVAGTKMTCPLVLPRSGVEGKRTLRERAKLVANDPKRTSRSERAAGNGGSGNVQVAKRNGPSAGCALRPSYFLDAIGRLWHPLRLFKDK